MKTITRFFMLALLLLSLVDKVTAQYTFVVDVMMGDSTALYPYDSKWNESVVEISDQVGMLPNGTEVTIAAGDTIPNTARFKSMKKGMFNEKVQYNDRVIAVTYAGQKYLVLAKDLMLSPNDTSGIDDFLNRKDNRHTRWGHLYYTFTPYIAIFVLLLLATLFAMFAGGSGGVRVIPALLMPLLVLAAIALEMFGVYSIGKDMLWWVDADHIKMGKVIVRLILFGLAIVMQIFSMRLYKNALVEAGKGELSIKRPIAGALIGVGLLVVCIVLAMIWNKDAETILTVGGVLLAISTLIGIISTAVTNIRAVGAGAGIAFTIFAVIWCIGLVAALVLLIIGLVNAFMEMIVTIGGGALVLFIMGKFIPIRTYTENGVTYEVYQ